MPAVSNIISLSQFLLDRLYAGAFPEIVRWLDQDIIWTDTVSSRYYYGCCQLLSQLSHAHTPKKYELRHLQYHILTAGQDTVIVTGAYKVIQKEADRSNGRLLCQVTLIWAAGPDTLRLTHIHISAESASACSEDFLCFHGKRAETYRLLPDEILYIEAENINCTVHTTSNTLSVRQPLGQMEKQLPRQFLRVHRSFIVNRYYVTQVYRYAIELSNHTVVPVPEKKYMSVMCGIEQFRG